MPLWCPYSMLGSPVYADPSSGFWYPVNMLLWYLFSFNAYVMKAEYAIHLLIAAVGMYKLALTITDNKSVAIISAIVYPLSGFFMAYPSLFSFIYSMAWLPYVLHYYIKGYRSGQYSYFVLCGVTMALCILAGYIVFPILACYVLLGLFLYNLYTCYNRVGFTKVFLLSATAACVCLILCSGYIYAMLDGLSQQVRSNALSLQSVSDNPFSPQSLISFLLPFSTLVDQSFFNTDISMRNGYMGLLALPLVVVAIRFGKTRHNILLLIIGCFFLFASFGSYSPFRAWLYYSLPFMKMFRHPAIFRAGTLLCLLIIAADGLRVAYTTANPAVKRYLGISVLLEGIVIGIIFIVAIQYGNIKLRFPDFSSVESVVNFNNADNIWSNIIVQSAEQGILLALIFIALLFYSGRQLAICISLLWVLDISMAAQMNIAGTMVCNVQVSKFAAAAQKLPRNFVLPEQQPVNKSAFYGGTELEPLVFSANMLHKVISNDGYNPFVLKSFKQFLRSGLYTHVCQQPVAYFAPNIKPWDNYIADSISGSLNKFSLYADVPIEYNADTPFISVITFTRLEANVVNMTVSTEQPAYLTLLQSYYPGWQAFVDGKPVSIIKTNFAFCTIPIDKGQHTVQFNFKPVHINMLAILQFILWFCTAIGILIFFSRRIFN